MEGIVDQVDCVWRAEAILGEGPIWDERENALYWIDIKAPAVMRYAPGDESRRSWLMPESIGGLAGRRDAPGFIAGLKSGLSFIDLRDGVQIENILDLEPDARGNRFNDGQCDARGRYWIGSMDDDESQASGWLYRVEPDLTYERVDGPYVVTNGPAISPDERTLYHTDSLSRTIYSFDLDDGGVLRRKTEFVRFERDDWGVPDGMVTDSDGFVWVACWGGWRVMRFAPNGTLDRSIELPVAQVTSCAFGGDSLDTLYITTASVNLDAAARRAQPLAGGLFSARSDVVGLPSRRFAR